MKTEFETLTNVNATGVGIKWRSTPQGYYFMRFYVDGTYSVYVVHGNVLDHLRAQRFSQYVNQGKKGNEFKVCAYGSEVLLYANGHQIDRIEDGNVENAGSLAIGLYVPSNSEAVLKLDDVNVVSIVQH